MTSEKEAQACFHCGLPVAEEIDLHVEVMGQSQPMCCAGCQAVAQAIVDNHLEDFYRHRTETSQRAEALVPDELREMQLYDNDKLQASFVHQLDGDVREAALILEGIVCAACVWLSERHVSALPGVLRFSVNYSTHRAQLKWDNQQIQLSEILQAIAAIGYHAHPFDPSRQEALQKKERSVALRRIGLAFLGMAQVMTLAVALYLGEYEGMNEGLRDLMRWAALVITTPVVFYSAQTFFLSAWRDLKSRRLGMDVPVSLAIGAAYAASVWATWTGTGEVYFDSVTMFTFFLLVGRFLEMSARHKAGQVAEELVKLMPATAHLKNSDGVTVIPVSELNPGDEILIKPGDAIPADGTVLEGKSSVDESLLTGESLPLPKQKDDQVIGGTINVGSPLSVRVEKVGQDTILAGISRLLERAQVEKPEIAQLANRVAGWFVSIILIIAVSVFSFWYFRLPADAFWITLSVLVVTCPCALSLATPVALTAATGALTKMGVLTTRGHSLETLAKTTDIIFDKTGTLTVGKLQLQNILPLINDLSKEKLHALAAGLEAHSEHPIGIALRKNTEALDVEVIESETGRGVLGRYQGALYRLGNFDYIHQWHDDFSPGQAIGTRVFLASEKIVLAAFELADDLREESKSVVQELASQGIEVHLLSGDNQASVEHIAAQLGLKHAVSRQLPDDKLAYVKKLQQQGKVVAMVGDGVNDAPVLAGAQVSIAMGGGAQLAQASADMVLLSDNLHHLPRGIEKSRHTLRIIRQNLSWAIGYNILALPLAAAGFIAPWMAAIGMSASSLIVVLNALRLRGK